MDATRRRTLLGSTLLILGASVAIVGFAPHVLGDCVVWCFFGRSAAAIAAGTLGIAAAAAGLVLIVRRTRGG